MKERRDAVMHTVIDDICVSADVVIANECERPPLIYMSVRGTGKQRAQAGMQRIQESAQ